MTFRNVKSPLRIEIGGLLGEGRLLRTSPHILEDATAVYSWIERNTMPGEILHVDEGFFGCAISIFTDRRTDNGAWKEVLQPWVLMESKKAGIRYGIVRMRPGQPFPEKGVIEIHGQYAIVDMDEFRRLQPAPPPFILQLVKLSEPLKKASGEVTSNPEGASSILMEVASEIRRIAGTVDKREIKRDLVNTADSLEKLAEEIPKASKVRRDEIIVVLDLSSVALEKGDIRSANLIIQEKVPERFIRR
jgi:hypothetical protein